jgi:hypothetical protein
MGPAAPDAAPLYAKVHFGFTDHPITVWAGVILLRLYFELVGLRAQLTAVLGGFGKRSNNQIPATRFVSRRRCAFSGPKERYLPDGPLKPGKLCQPKTVSPEGVTPA